MEGMEMDVSYPRSYLCIDVDIEEKEKDKAKSKKKHRDPLDPLALEKALYQYSNLPRRVFATRHGLHVYLPIKISELSNIWGMIAIRSVFGDDYYRIGLDIEKIAIGNGVVNKCFTSSERYEVIAW
jgi:hypothetical protein